jgi:hypothetical protein
MANAYYEAIAEYLAGRGSQVGYALDGAPSVVVAGTPTELAVGVRNAGDAPMRDWRLDVRATPSSALATGKAGPRTIVGSADIPRLAPGQRRTVTVTISAPAEPGEWVLLVDAADAQGSRASRAGSPFLEVPLVVVPAPTASPSTTPAHSAPPDTSPSPG